MILALVIPALQGGPAPNQQGSIPPSGTSNGAPPPLTGTPREQADRLFNRIMREREAGNVENATRFLPMAIAAYQQAGELDADGLYHLSILLTASGAFAEARQTAERVLSTNPDHLLALAAAADAAAQAGDSTAARNYYQQFLQKYDAEKDKPLPEYIDHTRMLPDHRKTAETFLSRR
jgi:tetratricopeptide (TPR) repeat protein